MGLGRLTRISGFVLFVCSVGVPAPAAAEWRRIDSPNFVVVGDVSPRTLRDVAVKFEGFRETITRVLGERVTTSPVPTVVIVFPSDRSFTPFKPRFNGRAVELSGLFLARPEINYIAVVADGQESTLPIVFHEYTHLMTSNSARGMPLWLSEGLAEFYSTYEMHRSGQEALIGRAVSHHVHRLRDTRLLPLDVLLEIQHDSALYNEGERRSVLYAQSWALTHMLLLGDPPRTKHLHAYLTRIGAGVPAQESWRQAFGDLNVERELSTYLRRRSFNAIRFTFSERIASFDPVAAPLSAPAAQAFLADFLLQQGRREEATERLGSALQAASGDPWVSTAAALLDIDNGDFTAAEERLLADARSADWFTSYRAMTGLTALAWRGGTSISERHLTAARRWLQAVGEGRGDIPHALASMTRLELDQQTVPSAEVRQAIERARAAAPGRQEYVFLHAQVLARQSEFAAARDTIAPLMSPLLSEDVRDGARNLMAYIVQLEQATQSGFREAHRDGGGASNPARKSVPHDLAALEPVAAAGGRRLVLRELQAGEQRLDGVLERIECAGDTARFHVRATDGSAHVSAARMDAVDFITYRDDLSGTVSCGPLEKPVRAYVTWRAGAESTQAIAVAIEFLPE